MDQMALAAATALVGAIVTDTWHETREAVIGLWRRVHPHQADDVGKDLDELRQQINEARRDGDMGTQKALQRTWQAKLQQLLLDDPNLAVDLQNLIDHVLTPSLPPAERTRIQKIIMSGSSHGSSKFTQIGIQTNYHKR